MSRMMWRHNVVNDYQGFKNVTQEDLSVSRIGTQKNY
jgi:hypothetical protein